jgi:bis(5'-nucleosyl)-tetraphosphatase (symmetrical)
MHERENIVVGDVHGCRDEFNELLDKIKYDPKQHRVLLVGDILDRGTDPVGLLKQIRKMELDCVLGNHEEKALRWRKYEALRDLTGQDNPMKPPSDDRRKEWESLSKNDLHWLSNLPLIRLIKDNWYIVHAGLEPAVKFEDQDLARIIRIRYVDKDGHYVKPKTKETPEGSEFWAGRWEQPYNIIFGHQRFDSQQIFKNKNNICIGVDTGCVFGNMLTAYNIERNEFIQVKAKKTYYKR